MEDSVKQYPLTQKIHGKITPVEDFSIEQTTTHVMESLENSSDVYSRGAATSFRKIYTAKTIFLLKKSKYNFSQISFSSNLTVKRLTAKIIYINGNDIPPLPRLNSHMPCKLKIGRAYIVFAKASSSVREA